jgi:hypothetical protein
MKVLFRWKNRSMRRLAILVFMAAMVLPARTEEPVSTPMLTVEQLEEFLSAAQGLKDKELAKQIYDLRLTQRLSDANLTRLEKGLPGPKSQEALTAIADESAFLDLPPAEIPSVPAPDPAALRALLASTIAYATKTVHRLPNFYATRVTTAFVGTPTAISHRLHDALPVFSGVRGRERLVAVGTSSVTVLYRDGQDAYADEEQRVRDECGMSMHIAISSGQFGQIIAMVPKIAAQGSLSWSHWEQDATGLQAVFHYSVILPVQDDLNCPNEVGEDLQDSYQYHGEVAVNPADGSILRVTRVARERVNYFGYGGRTGEDEMMVKYGPLEIGGTVYICPAKSIYVGLAPALLAPEPQRESFNRRFGLTEDPVWEGVEDITFEKYHLF